MLFPFSGDVSWRFAENTFSWINTTKFTTIHQQHRRCGGCLTTFNNQIIFDLRKKENSNKRNNRSHIKIIMVCCGFWGFYLLWIIHLDRLRSNFKRLHNFLNIYIDVTNLLLRWQLIGSLKYIYNTETAVYVYTHTHVTFIFCQILTIFYFLLKVCTVYLF